MRRRKSHRPRFIILSLFHFLLFTSIFTSSFAQELIVKRTNSVLPGKSSLKMPNQLPRSWVARGTKNIRVAWFGGATDRYRHGILGDAIEASQLIVETAESKQLVWRLPDNRVFEDLEPRLVDLDRDGQDEILVIESDINSGASLALYAIIAGQLRPFASTPFLGRRNRWLNPVGVGDFDGNGQLDIALVATPHIGGILRLYRFTGSAFHLFAEYAGVSTHKIGSTELGLGRVVDSNPRDLLLLPDQSHSKLLLLKWTPAGITEIASTELNGRIASSLIPIDKRYWRFRLANGDHYELFLRKNNKPS